MRFDRFASDLRNRCSAARGLVSKFRVKVVGQFVDGGVVLYERSRTDEKAYETDKGNATNLPLVVLVNKGTASVRTAATMPAKPIALLRPLRSPYRAKNAARRLELRAATISRPPRTPGTYLIMPGRLRL